MRRAVFLGVLLLALNLRGADTPKPGGIEWQDWSPAVFEKAKAGKKPVILDLHAVWCHWCHVMDEQTYSNPKVISLIRSNYIAVGVDQDSRPDLASRYEDYGWPATIIFDANGRELARRRGYIPPEEMASVLQAFIDDPTPGPSVTGDKTIEYSTQSSLPGDLRTQLERAVVDGYDQKYAGWGAGGQKFLDWDNVEYCMSRAAGGDPQFEKMAKETLAAQTKLIDPVWGGVDQYSTDGDWDHPHFEKIIQFQAENLRIYSAAYAVWKDPQYLKTAQAIHGFVKQFLTSPEGSFYTSQDADVVPGEHAGEYYKLDDDARRKIGLPKIDTHIYARENGWMIHALVQMHTATGDKVYLSEALTAMRNMMNSRLTKQSGWLHDHDSTGLYLGDTLYMARAQLDLYAATADPVWLLRAKSGADFIIRNFMPAGANAAGVPTSARSDNGVMEPKPEYDENVAVARFANLLAHYTDDPAYRKLAECAMRYLTTPEVALKRHAFVGGLLLADTEMNSEPLHVVVVGGKNDPVAKEMFEAAARYPLAYKQIEWQDKTEPALHKEMDYPAMANPAAFICAGTSCSAPIFNAADIAPRIASFSTPPKDSGARLLQYH
ncbi:MAG TPA: DUF255 domain-containing protein [Chthoniobacteraceae bacterium]|nr:DUF255 domain-containing protein [Chthoniobacteraceae bacterium]